MEKKPNTAKNIVIVICLILLVIFGIHQFLLLSWNTWVNEVRIACQPGGNEESVKSQLGEPISIKRTEDMVGNGFPPVQAMPQASKVYLYGNFLFNKGVWFTFVFFDESGSVVGCHFARS